MPLEPRLTKLEQTVTDLEDIQQVQIEVSELKATKIEYTLEALNQKLHALSNFQMGLENKIDELAEFATQLQSDIDDLRESIKSFNNRSNTDSEATV